LTKRIDLRAVIKSIGKLILAGGFDSFSGLRSQYFHDEGDGITFMKGDKVWWFQENENSSQVSLFGESSDVQIAEPVIPP
jgi:DNA polymerase-3 subunit alpha